jgi:hypothetical protein
MKARDILANYLDASLGAKKDGARLFIVRRREGEEALRRDIQLLTRLLAASRHLSENATSDQVAARSQRDRDRNARIQTTFANADRRMAALKARKASGKPSGPMDTKKAQKEAERVQRLDQQMADIRTNTATKVGDIRSRMGK